MKQKHKKKEVTGDCSQSRRNAVLCCHFMQLTISVLPTKTNYFVNIVDPDETAHYEPSHQDLHCLPFCFDF